MASPILPSLGLGSGINTSSIVDALVAAEKQPKQAQITRQLNSNTASISAIGTLTSALSAYQASLDKLKSSTSPAFLAFAATSSDTKFVTATASNTAVSGTYAIEVGSLATASKIASKPLGIGTAITAGQLTISQGSGASQVDYTVDIGSGATLQSVRDSINSTLQSKGITANIINDGTDSRLVLSSTTTGANSDLSTSGIPELIIDGTSKMTGSGGGYINALAADAAFTVDGMSMTSKSNTVDQAISGLSFNLVAAGSSTVTVGTNTDGLKTSVQSFVDAYNNLIKTINTLTKTTEDADGKLTKTAPLTGDASVRGLLSSLRNELVVPASGGNGQLKVLSQLGINTVQADGTLEFNSTTFTSALTDKKLGSEIQNLFNANDGLLSRMSNAIAPYTGSDGIFASRSKTLEATKKSLATQQANLDVRITNLTASLSKKYNAMDALVGKLKATASNITSMFDAMNAQKANS
ncbi:flagellar filament capping protein FliD [Pseudomonas akapageensis]|uniref:flagellar filament capping protein FliD n=1 Tax=Pseudomonas akapageensis TaxID=2609961 RepID=UPI00140BD5F0|nr:flagellar filament capping protein FliD [Pseudomonas akapageensis]